MKKTLSIIAVGLGGVLASAVPARAAFETENIYEPVSIVTLIVLLCSILCLIWAFKVLSLVRGGLLSKSWQMFVLGFGFLLLAQIVSLGQQIAIISLPGFVVTTFYLLMSVTWLLGLYQTRRILG
jgi:lysylphosphatidylglycerol synthetase-like protein (DUF2156 family)